MFSLCEILPRPWPTIDVLDVGASDIPGEPAAYHKLVRQGVARVTGFEAVEEECRKLNSSAPETQRFLPYAVGNGSTGTFRQCNIPATSSLFEPNRTLLDRFQNLGEFTRVVRESLVETRRLDDIAEVESADYLKLDVQGAEYDVIEGAARVLSSTLVVHTEVEFVPLYLGQPLFAEVDQALRRQGFCFHRFTGLAGRTFKPMIAHNDPNALLSQMLWADAVYVRDWMHWDALNAGQLLKTALILHDVYGSADLCMIALAQHDRKTGSAICGPYLRRLQNAESGQRAPRAPLAAERRNEYAPAR